MLQGCGRVGRSPMGRPRSIARQAAAVGSTWRPRDVGRPKTPRRAVSEPLGGRRPPRARGAPPAHGGMAAASRSGRPDFGPRSHRPRCATPPADSCRGRSGPTPGDSDGRRFVGSCPQGGGGGHALVVGERGETHLDIVAAVGQRALDRDRDVSAVRLTSDRRIFTRCSACKT